MAMFRNMSRGKKAALVAAAAAVLIAAGLVWGRQADRTPVEVTGQALVQNEPFAVKVSFADGQPRAGQTAHVHFTTLRDGQVFDLVENSYLPHVIISSENYQSFIHTIEPEHDAPGVYGVDFEFGEPGEYRIWFEVDNYESAERHGEDAALIAFADVNVEGKARADLAEPFVRGKTAQAGPYAVELEHGDLKAGAMSQIELSVRDERGQMMPLAQPEPNIFVMIGPRGDDDFPFFRHGHGEPAEGGITIVWREIFPKAGEYLLWTTVYLVNDEMGGLEAVEVPFWLEVSD